MTVIRELVTKLGFDADEATLDSWDRRVGLLAAGLGLVVAAAGAAGLALVGMANEVADEAEELLKLSKATKATTDDLQALQYAASVSETNVEAVGNALIFMRKNTGKTGLDEFLKQLESIQKLKPEDQVEEVMKVFGRGGKELLPLIEEGPEAIRKLVEEYKALGVALTPEQIAAADEYGDSITKIKAQVKGLRMQIGAGFMPVLQDMVNTFQEWYTANRAIIKSRIDGVLKAALAVLRPIGQVLGFVLSLLGKMIDVLVDLGPLAKALFIGAIAYGISIAVVALNGFLASLTLMGVIIGTATTLTNIWAAATARLAAVWAFITSPVILLAAFLALVGLIIEDIKVWQAGGESLIGTWVGSWTDFLDSIDRGVAFVKEQFNSLWTLVIDMVQWLDEHLLKYIPFLNSGMETSQTFVQNAQQTNGAAPQAMTQDAVGAGTVLRAPQPNVTQRNNIKVNVPPGTNKEQADFILNAVEQAIGNSWAPIADNYVEAERGN